MSLLLLLRPHHEEQAAAPSPGHLRYARRGRPIAIALEPPNEEDDELVAWVQTHHPDPLRPR